MAELCILDAGNDVSAEAIERGLQVGEALIIARGHTVELAYQAVLSRANNERHNNRAANAWDSAEDAVFAEVWGDRDDWPDDAVLSIVGAK
jgi:hypothetical protein